MLEKWKTAADDKWKQRAKIHLGIGGGGGGWGLPQRSVLGPLLFNIFIYSKKRKYSRYKLEPTFLLFFL